MAKLDVSKMLLTDGREITFRNLNGEDAKSFIHFCRQVAHDSTHTMQYVGQNLLSTEQMASRLIEDENDSASLNVAAFYNSQIIGHLGFRLIAPEHPWFKHIGRFGMAVLKDFWGLGIAKHLLIQQEAHAEAIGVTRIEAMVRVKNDRGVRLYRRRGYNVEGTRKNAAQIDGEYVDEYFIAKLLNKANGAWVPPTLETDRLLLRPIEIADAPAIFNYAKNPNVCRYTLWQQHQSVQDSADYIKDYVFENYAKGVLEPLGIALKDNPGVIIGTVGCFWTSQASRAMELAYAIGEEHWGQGLVAEASQAVMNYCFKEYGLKRIQARCKSENLASAQVMKKVGMSFEGTLKSALFHRDRYWDMEYYAKVID